mgnify:CR=1 FL=1
MNTPHAPTPSTLGTIDRREFVRQLLAHTPDALVITGLGSPTYDVFAAGDSANHFYLWGAMGGTTAMGLGLALAQPERPVLIVTGDGEQLMGMGSLATAAETPDFLQSHLNPAVSPAVVVALTVMEKAAPSALAVTEKFAPLEPVFLNQYFSVHAVAG